MSRPLSFLLTATFHDRIPFVAGWRGRHPRSRQGATTKQRPSSSIANRRNNRLEEVRLAQQDQKEEKMASCRKSQFIGASLLLISSVSIGVSANNQSEGIDTDITPTFPTGCPTPIAILTPATLAPPSH